MNQRILDWDGCINVRDLGGIPTQKRNLDADGGQLFALIHLPGSPRQVGIHFTITVSAR